MHRKLYNPPSNFSLFSDEKFWSLSPKEYMPLFTSSTPEGNYGTLIASTAGHWTTTVLHGFRDESKEDSGYGIDKVLDFFEQAMKVWATQVQEALDQDQKNGSRGVKGARKVVVRSYLPGHEDCRNIYEPWKEWKPFVWNWYNWAWIKDFNQIFQVCSFLQKSRVAVLTLKHQKLLSSPSFPDIHYLTMDRPALLRPDGVILLALTFAFSTDRCPLPARIGRLSPHNDRRRHHGRMVTLYLAFRHERTGRRHSMMRPLSFQE